MCLPSGGHSDRQESPKGSRLQALLGLGREVQGQEPAEWAEAAPTCLRAGPTAHKEGPGRAPRWTNILQRALFLSS